MIVLASMEGSFGSISNTITNTIIGLWLAQKSPCYGVCCVVYMGYGTWAKSTLIPFPSIVIADFGSILSFLLMLFMPPWLVKMQGLY